MKEISQIRRIQGRASKFKQRAYKSPSDLKRHDRIRPDEQKWMHIAYNQLRWSYAKIGHVFDRDPRAVKASVEKEQEIRSARKKYQQENEQQLIQQQQKEHIKMLQQMARSALDHLPDFPDLHEDHEVFDSFNHAVVEVYRRLTGDIYWKRMAEHLGDDGKEIEMMSSVLDDVLPGGSSVRPKLDEYKRNLEEAWFLIKIGGLKTISESNDTGKWEWEGLNQRCQNCPDQEYEPVDITPEDITSSRVFPEITLSDLQDHSDENSSTGK